MNRIKYWAVAASAVLLTACASKFPLLTGPAPVDNGANMVTPMTQKRETLVATGYAVISIGGFKDEVQHALTRHGIPRGVS
ncbi:hypothetical protein [Limnohabitans sp.]|uniref:hypothetical protein n=1 Tax=Limnohabitans sp. TaxID=1907725 RepID=UPI00286F84BB|nr:hypothetical protein [Limnohabitans sp.]